MINLYQNAEPLHCFVYCKIKNATYIRCYTATNTCYHNTILSKTENRIRIMSLAIKTHAKQKSHHHWEKKLLQCSIPREHALSDFGKKYDEIQECNYVVQCQNFRVLFSATSFN